MRKKKTLVTYRVCITKRPRDMTALDRFLNKKMTFSGCFNVFRQYCFLPEKEMRLHCNLQMQKHAPIIWAKFNFV